MKLENQVCSLELAKKLRELGVPQESLWYWKNYCEEWFQPMCSFAIRRGKYDNFIPEKAEEYAAFTVAELGEIMKHSGMGTSAFSGMSKKWWVTGGKWNVEKQRYEMVMTATDEADTRAKMLIYLIENGFMGETNR